MKIITQKEELKEILYKFKQNNRKIGLIPTMGSIHKGHLSLVEKSKNLGCFSLVSIFVNPTQFNDPKDFNEYPRDINKDINLLKDINCNAIYIPKIIDLYPQNTKSKKTIFDFRNILCDKFRPGHFDGVTTVVRSLFNIIKPDIAFFGEKDFQQLKMIERIVDINSLPIVIHACPSVRLKNGMSFSSRYNNFSLDEKKKFNHVSLKLIQNVKLLINKFDLQILKKLKKEIIEAGVTKIDYIEIRDEKNLSIVNNNKNARLFLAFYINRIRIIDNFILY